MYTVHENIVSKSQILFYFQCFSMCCLHFVFSFSFLNNHKIHAQKKLNAHKDIKYRALMLIILIKSKLLHCLT